MNSGTSNFRCRVSNFTSLLRRHCIEAGKWVVAEMFELDMFGICGSVCLWMSARICHLSFLCWYTRHDCLFGSDMLPSVWVRYASWLKHKRCPVIFYGNSKNSYLPQTDYLCGIMSNQLKLLALQCDCDLAAQKNKGMNAAVKWCNEVAWQLVKEQLQRSLDS